MYRVLVVDDEKSVIDILIALQNFCNYQVAGVATDGKESIEKYAQLNPKPDVVLMDQRMPVMNGIEATIEILKIDPKAKVLFVSADPSIMKKALEVGAKGFVEKPFAIRDLREAIERAATA